MRRLSTGIVAVLLLALVIPGCILQPLNSTDPTIMSMTVTPSQISQNDTGSPTKTFTIQMTVANFQGTIKPSGVSVFIQTGNVNAVPANTTIDGDTITLTGVQVTWFANLPPGTYDLGASITTDVESVTERNLATVTVVP